MAKSPNGKTVFIAMAVLAIAIVVWFLISPLFIDRKVDEAFPEVPSKNEPAAMSPEQRNDVKQDVLAAAADRPSSKMEEAMPAQIGEPMILAQGKFEDADAIHKGSGDAKLYRSPTTRTSCGWRISR